jgi:uncharacterized protein YjbI with pentapeptide repeats
MVELQSTPDNTSPLREISPEELKKILDEHLEWIKSRGKKGRKADLSQTNLKTAHLQGADLRQADLSFADFGSTNLREANFQDANLNHAVLDGAVDLIASQLAGANLSGAKLPEAILKVDGLKYIEDLSKNASKIFIAMLLACIYSFLTIVKTTDVGLITNSTSSPLPIIGTEIPIVGFYWFAPLILLALYFYFHLHLQRLWESLSDQPAIFPDGVPLHKKAYPWMLNWLVTTHFVQLRSNRPALSRLQVFIAGVLAWWIVPLTIYCFWERSLSKHDWAETIIQIGLLVVAIWSGLGFYNRCKETLRRENQPLFFTGILLKSLKTYKWGALIILLVCVFSFGVIEGIDYEFGTDKYLEATSSMDELRTCFQSTRHELEAIKVWLPCIFSIFDDKWVADFDHIDVSTKPPNWTGHDDKEIALVKGASLSNTKLQYTRARESFLVNASLHSADLEGAWLTWADLTNANLSYADLRAAKLIHANLSGANLTFSKLNSLESLKKVFLNENHQNNIIDNMLEIEKESNPIIMAFRALLSIKTIPLKGEIASEWTKPKSGWGANLQEANLTKAILIQTNLQGANLMMAKLQKADLSFADLSEVTLRGADLRGAILLGTNFNEAKLSGTDLSGAIHLKQEQINKACVDETTKLPHGLKKPPPCKE